MSGDKSDKIKQRRMRILHILSSCPGGQAQYTLLQSKLKEDGFNVGERRVRDDCTELAGQGVVRKVRNGAAITEEGGNIINGQGSIGGKYKKKYLKQLAILKALYDCEMTTGLTTVKGLLPREIAKLKGIGEEDTVKDILQKMAGEGLVRQNGERWSIGAEFPGPIRVEGKKEASLLYEYLTTVTDLVPLSPDLTILKSKLIPLMIIPGRYRWREELAKIVMRVIVHGRGTGDDQDTHQMMALAQEAVLNSRVIDGQYRGRSLKLHPLGVVYHWDKGQWYIIARNPAQRAVMPYLLNRFSRIQITDTVCDSPANFDMVKYLQKRWGISGDQKLDVIACFQSTDWHRTALEKLKADVSRRRICNGDCRLEEQADGSIILYDKVEGLSEFARWIRSYGDAVQVLEPAALRAMMYSTGRKMLARYGQGGADNE